MADRKQSLASGVLEKLTPRDQAESGESTETAGGEAGRGRGAARKVRDESRTTKKPKARTIYLPDALFERILVQAHRKDKTISEYVTSLLERSVPDYRTVRAESDQDAA